MDKTFNSYVIKEQPTRSRTVMIGGQVFVCGPDGKVIPLTEPCLGTIATVLKDHGWKLSECAFYRGRGFYLTGLEETTIDIRETEQQMSQEGK